MRSGTSSRALRAEATARGYRFDGSRILRPDAAIPGIPVTDGQLAFELAHLRAKVAAARRRVAAAAAASAALAAPSFVVVPGGIEEWERP